MKLKLNLTRLLDTVRLDMLSMALHVRFHTVDLVLQAVELLVMGVIDMHGGLDGLVALQRGGLHRRPLHVHSHGGFPAHFHLGRHHLMRRWVVAGVGVVVDRRLQMLDNTT